MVARVHATDHTATEKPKSITVGGRRYLVSTTDLKEGSATGIGRNKRTAKAVGGGAALGSILDEGRLRGAGAGKAP